MSAMHDPAAPLSFCVELLAASIRLAAQAAEASAEVAVVLAEVLARGTVLAAEAGAVLAVQSAKGLNMVREEGVDAGRQLGEETFAFLSGGATMSASMAGDLKQGAKGELMHGVKEGGRIFSAAIGKSEVMFERCGTAIIGKLTDENQEAIDRDMTERIAEAYQLILEQVNEISVGKDSTMQGHLEAMEQTKQSLAALKAENEAIGQQLALMEEERQRAETSIQEVEDSMDAALKASVTAANQAFKESIKALNKEMATKEKAQQALKLKNEERLLEQLGQQARLEELELRKEQASEFGDVHRARIKEHTTREVERIMAEHGLENPVIQLSEDENNRIRIHIEE
jgi:hypothetical protein